MGISPDPLGGSAYNLQSISATPERRVGEDETTREVPFAIPLYMQCILHGLNTALLCVSFIFVHHEKCQLHVMVSIFYGNGL